ncbi:MAG: 2-oxo acid dehydrogenase subunit E2 [Hyphomonadaceae bacterium]|nr:2-oxo acid dehydrogenase subunit E2 [Hyphomonadaceae bacterium]
MPIEILMPALSPTMEEGTLASWLVKEGDPVNSGDVLAEIETDKATMEVEAVDEGKIAKILIESGTEGVKVNTPIAILLEDGEDESMLEGYGVDSTSDYPRKNGDDNHGDRIFASPLARRLAEQEGLDLSAIDGSGPKERIIKRDIEAALASRIDTAAAQPETKTKPEKTVQLSESTEVGMLRGGGAEYLAKLGVEPGSYDLIPLSNIQKLIARRLSDSNNNVPDFPLTVDCDIDELLRMREELNGQVPEGIRISINDMLIRACALALKHVPEANASYTPDGIALHRHADVAVAVAIDGGLITPIVREAENKGLSTISGEMKDLAGRARERRLQPQEYQGGTFSISNLGMFGIREFGSIISEPHGMILSVGAGSSRPIVKDGEIMTATVMTVTLTCDHRVVDGALGARWLEHFKRYVEQPITMML